MKLPAYYPDSDAIKSEMLDYAVEVEWFDTHLGRILAHLEAAGELDNTLILVTSDHGMPFPRVKGQMYDAGFHLPRLGDCFVFNVIGRRAVTGRCLRNIGTSLTHWTEMPRGGHFAAMEQPELLVEDVRKFFRDLR